ncbi:MAG: hypothetical protein K0U74_12505, partial [Alphaproteobacteria bacterium]|nr:hypothetical protein [Alphaproteobacteria bacterium]
MREIAAERRWMNAPDFRTPCKKGGLDVYFQKVVRFLHWRLSIRSGPGTLMLRNVSDSPEDRMNVHKNAPL